MMFEIKFYDGTKLFGVVSPSGLLFWMATLFFRMINKAVSKSTLCQVRYLFPPQMDVLPHEMALKLARESDVHGLENVHTFLSMERWTLAYSPIPLKEIIECAVRTLGENKVHLKPSVMVNGGISIKEIVLQMTECIQEMYEHQLTMHREFTVPHKLCDPTTVQGRDLSEGVKDEVDSELPCLPSKEVGDVVTPSVSELQATVDENVPRLRKKIRLQIELDVPEDTEWTTVKIKTKSGNDQFVFKKKMVSLIDRENETWKMKLFSIRVVKKGRVLRCK